LRALYKRSGADTAGGRFRYDYAINPPESADKILLGGIRSEGKSVRYFLHPNA